MTKTKIKNYITTFLITYLMLSPIINTVKVYAAPTVENVCSSELDKNATPDIFQTICPIVAFFNVFLISAGAAFIVVGLYSAIKMSLAQGDPKALSAGKNSLWLAFLAFVGFVFIGTFFTILNNTLGLGISILEEPIGPFNKVLSELYALLCSSGTNGHIMSGAACN